MATALGLCAILMWSLLALLTAKSGTVPPFQLNAMCFTLGALVGLVALRTRRVSFAVFRQRPAVWMLGVAGLFGYHALYFAALRSAPAAEASLIAFFWPLLIVLGSAMLPGERLRWYHLTGAILGLCGAGFIILGRADGLAFKATHVFGYALATLCALTWSSYSLLSRRFGEVPSDAVTGFCAVTALLSLIAHLFFETTVWPTQPMQWAAILGLGLLPVGAAFYLWDIGVKRGDIQLLGAVSYAAPLLSTFVLILAGETALSLSITLAACLITAGAALAALPLFLKLARGS